MSTTIDQKVVEMRFNNQQFERNAQTSLNTLEKLKQSLNLTGASKGLEQLNSAARNNDIGALGRAADAVGVKFSAMQVIGTTALVNMTNSAINAGKRIVRALTIDPVKTGFQEYELKMGSVQTIMASTGESLETVNQYLNELNKYSDQTIYSFSDMTNNIGKFTNAGVKLEDAVTAIKGVSNEAAISGANANEASRAMYNFAQALSAGYVKLIDWKSIENANMATVDFKNQLLETAVSLGTVTKGADGMYKTLKGNAFNATKNFNEVLQDQWMTSEVLITTLKKYADETTDIGKKATQAATEVKTFSMMCDTLKEAAQSGWATSWEIVFGDFNQGKELWTSMANSIGAVIDKMSDVRNTFLKGVFWEPWKLAAEQIDEAGLSVEDFKKKLLKTAGVTYKASTYEKRFTKALKDGKITKEVVVKTLESYTGAGKKSSKTTEDMTAKLKKFQKICDEVWKGTYGNGQKRVEALTKAGYKYNEVQELVNKTQHGRKLTLDDLSASQLKSIGYTDKEIEAIQKLADEAKTTGTDFNKLIENLSRPSGRELVLDTVNNLLKEFSKLTEASGKAFNKVFGDADASGGFYKLIENLRDLSEEFHISEKAATNFQKIFEGAFSALELTWNVAGWGLRTTLKLISAVLGLFGTDLLSVAAYVADLITKFNEWAQKNTIWWGYINNTAKIIHAFVEGIYDCIKAVVGLEKVGEVFNKVWGGIGKLFGIIDFKAVDNNVQTLVDLITTFFDKLEAKIKSIDNLKIDISWDSFKNFLDYVTSVLPTFEDLEKGFEKIRSVISKFFNWLGSMKESENLGRDIVLGIAKGIKSTASEAVEAIKNVGITIKEAFCKLLGIHSPSKVFIAIGGFIVAGLIYGIKNSARFIGMSTKEIVTQMFTIAGDAIQNGIPYIVDLVKTLSSKILEGLKASEIDLGSLFVVGSMVTVAFFLNKILKVLDNLTGGVTSPLKALRDLFVHVTNLVDEFTKNQKAIRFGVYAKALESIAKSVAIMAGIFIVLSKIDLPNAKQGLIIMISLVGMLAMLTFAAAKLEPTGFGKLSVFAMAMSASLLIMSVAIKRLASIDPERATVAVYQFAGLIIGFAGLMSVFGMLNPASAWGIDKAGAFIAKVGLAIGTMALVMKLVASLSPDEITKGLAFIAGVGSIFAAITKFGDYSSPNADKAGTMILKMSFSIGLLALVMKLIAKMSVGDIGKGLIVVGLLGLMFAGFTNMYAGLNAQQGEIVKAGRTMLAMSASIGILAIAMKLIATMSVADIQKGMGVIFYISLLFAAFVKVSNYAGDNASKAGRMLLGMAAAMGILAITIKLVNGISTSDIVRGMTVIAGFEALFGAIVYISKFAGEHADKAGTMLIKMSAAILVMVAAIAILSLIKPEKIALATAAIDSMMLCFAALVGVTKFAKVGKKAQTTMLVMVGVVGALAGIIALLTMMDDTQGVLASATALSILVTTLAGVTAALSKMTMAKLPTSALGTMALLGLILAELAGVLWLMKKLDVQPSIEASAGLVVLLAGMAGVCYLMSGLVSVAVPAAIGIAAFGALVAELAVVLAALGKLYQMPGLSDVIADGGKLLYGLGAALGGFIGGIIGGIGAGVSSALPLIGDNLSKFWNNASGFVYGVSGIKASVTSGMKNLAEAILILTGAGLLDLASKWITGGSSLGSFAADLKPFGEGIKAFATEVEGIDGKSIEGAVDAAKSLAEIADVIPNSGGLISKLVGDNKLSDFGSQLFAFGSNLKSFSSAVYGMGDNEDGLNAAIKTTKALADLAQNLPNIGGLMGRLLGEVNITTFGEQLEEFGGSLKKYSESVVGLQVEPINTSIAAAKGLADLANTLPNIGGMATAFVGTSDMATFGDTLVSFGKSMYKYSESVTDLAVEPITTSVIAAKKLVDLADTMSRIGGLNIKGFAKQIVKFGDGLKNYSDKVAGVNGSAISLSIVSATSIFDFINSLNDLNTSGISKFNSALIELGETGIDDFVKAFTSDTSKLTTAGSNVIMAISRGVESKRSSLKVAVFSVVNEAANAINDKLDTVKSAGTNFVNKFTSAIKDRKSNVESAGTSIAKACISYIRLEYGSFYTAGEYLVKGFASGIKDNMYRAEAKSRAMARAAKEAAKEELDEHSPSKEFYKIGNFAGLGFVNALDLYADKAYNSSANMADKAKAGLNAAIAKVNSFVADGVETQPTIRPVLDLSNVKTGMQTMEGMLSTNKSVGVSANLNAITTMMGNRGQNGENGDIVSAINKLRKDLGNVGGDTYVVDGVTYDDGTNISEAVKTLVRAAKVERRR